MVDDGLPTESGDRTFVPDVVVRDGDVLSGDGFRFECLHTPGHISNHICFAELERDLMFPGDHVMGWSTTVVSPPDGAGLGVDDLLEAMYADVRTELHAPARRSVLAHLLALQRDDRVGHDDDGTWHLRRA